MGGYQLMVAGEVLRARFRKSFEKPEPVVPGQVTEYTHRPARQPPLFPQGTQDHGAGAEHLVPVDRPQSAEVCAEHLRSDGCRFPAGPAARLSFAAVSDAYQPAGIKSGSQGERPVKTIGTEMVWLGTLAVWPGLSEAKPRGVRWGLERRQGHNPDPNVGPVVKGVGNFQNGFRLLVPFGKQPPRQIGFLEISDGVTRATRIAKLTPSVTVPVVVIGRYRRNRTTSQCVRDQL